MDQNNNQKSKFGVSGWARQGGRMYAQSDTNAEDSAADANNVVEQQSEDKVISEEDLFPPEGSPPSLLAEAAFLWLEHCKAERRDAQNVTLLHLRNLHMQPEKQEKDLQENIMLDREIVFIEGAAEWFDEAERNLREITEKSLGRFAPEWYMWAQTAMFAETSGDTFAADRRAGYEDGRRETLRFIERLARPNTDD